MPSRSLKMTEFGAWPLLQMGLMAGLLHSLDADHVAAVAGLSSQKQVNKRWQLSSLHWAFGHGAAVITVALAVFMLGVAIPHQLSEWAEHLVAYALMLIGVLAGLSLMKEYRGRQQQKSKNHLAGKAAAVGLLHGCAGSAPLLALLPITTISSPVWGMVYVGVFCFGVAAAMLLLGSLLSIPTASDQQNVKKWSLIVRAALASLSFIIGVYLAFIV